MPTFKPSYLHTRRYTIPTVIRPVIILSLILSTNGLDHSLPTTTNTTLLRHHRHLVKKFNHNPTPNPWPSLAWLASYPFSGGAYIRKAIHTISQTTMATNYKYNVNQNHQQPKVGLDDHTPFRMRRDLPLPPHYILTETHCAGTCVDCHRRDFYVTDEHEFYMGCSTGSYAAEETREESVLVTYDSEGITKMVHLYRHPLEIIAIRFHHARELVMAQSKDRIQRGGGDEWDYVMNRDGLINWCRDFDDAVEVRRVMTEKLTDAQREQLDSVPCHGLVYQIIMWHNNIVDMTKKYSMETLVVHLEDYRDDSQPFIDALFDFVKLPKAAGRENRRPAVPNENYDRFFTPEDRLIISSFVKVLAAGFVWAEVKRYFPYPEKERMFSSMGSVLSPIHYGTWPDVAWLMTFPNSGTGYVTQSVNRAAGRKSSASNYAAEMLARREDIPNFAYSEYGPFRVSFLPFPSFYILTKTHCQRCRRCDPKGGRTDLVITPTDFLQGCTRAGTVEPVVVEDGEGGEQRVEYERDIVNYDPAIAKRVVHLIRNPFDNIVANFHYEYKSRMKNVGKWRFENDKGGFRSWCEWLDKQYDEEDYMKIYEKREVVNVARLVPCHGVFFQYIQWHNNAFHVPEMLSRDFGAAEEKVTVEGKSEEEEVKGNGFTIITNNDWDGDDNTQQKKQPPPQPDNRPPVPSLVVYYEDFRNRRRSMMRILDFLRLPSVNEAPMFYYNPHPDYFTLGEYEAVEKFVNLMGSKETIAALKRYFTLDEKKQRNIVQ